MFGLRKLSLVSGAGHARHLLRKGSQLGNSLLILQDGVYMQELPILVKHTKDHSFILGNFDPRLCGEGVNSNGICTAVLKATTGGKSGGTGMVTNVSEGEQEYMGAIERADTVRHIYSLLETATVQGITPFVALHSLVRIARLESQLEEAVLEHRFGRQAIIQKLMQTILEGHDNETMVNTFLFMKDLQPLGQFATACEQLRDICISKGASGELTIEQVTKVIRGLISVYGTRSVCAEQLWQGIKHNSAQISERNVVDVFSVLPLLKQSTKVVFRTGMKQLANFWWKLEPDAMCCLLDSVYLAHLNSVELCQIVSKWMSLALHQFKEQHVQVLLRFFCQADYCDDSVERAVERYCRARGPLIKEKDTAVVIAEFAHHFNIISSVVLNTVSDHFVKNHAVYGEANPSVSDFHLLKDRDSPPSDITAVVRAHGELAFPPTNSIAFFSALENQLKRRFSELPPEDILDICLACVYLKKYPLNFFREVFNPFFLERLPAGEVDRQRLRMKLSVLDAALTRECPGYRGPMLPRDATARSVSRDLRSARLGNALLPILQTVPGVSAATPSCLLPQLPLHPLYLPDLSCQLAGHGRLVLFVNPPELYSRRSRQLLGAVQLRRRLLTQLGLTPVELPLQQLAPLVVYPAELKQQLTQIINTALQ